MVIAFVALSLLLLAASLHNRVGWLRRLGLPESLIAGGLISVVFATLFLGQALPSRWVLWQGAASQTAFGMVLGFG